jgi:MoxR-like ATPase
MTDHTQDTAIEQLMANFDADRSRGHFLASIDIFEEACPGLRDVGEMLLSSTCLKGINSSLLEGLPGAGKTRSMEVGAALIGGDLNIVQGNPDLSPNMVLGSEFMDKDDAGKTLWRIKWGRFVRSHINFLDEINRCNPRFQSVWMGAMSEKRVTMQAPHIEDESLTTAYLPDPSMFLAAQNDVGSEGTYPLPPASYDRFLRRKLFTRIPRWCEVDLLDNPNKADREAIEYAAAKRLLTLDQIRGTREWVRANMRHTHEFSQYLATVVRLTHPETEVFRRLWQEHEEIRPILEMVKSGISVRGNISFLRACQVRAFLFGKKKDGKTPRQFLMPEDVRALVHSIGDHRVIMNDLAETFSKGKGPHAVAMFDEYPTDGTITREQIVHRLNRKGRNPILPAHVIDVALAYSDFTDDPTKFEA